jgi:GPH family glycoside/pentoside/hexuronide:cation symporter
MEDQVPVVMLVMLVFVALALFPWKMLAERWNKGQAYALGLFIGASAIVATFFLPNHPTWWIYLIAIIAGIGFSANWVFPWAMVPDVVEYDRLNTGEYRGGMYFGVWGLAVKISEALGVVATGWILQLYKYIPNAAQTPETLFGIRLFFGPIPAFFLLLSLPLLIRYPITRARHAEVLAQLSARDGEARTLENQ